MLYEHWINQKKIKLIPKHTNGVSISKFGYNSKTSIIKCIFNYSVAIIYYRLLILMSEEMFVGCLSWEFAVYINGISSMILIRAAAAAHLHNNVKVEAWTADFSVLGLALYHWAILPAFIYIYQLISSSELKGWQDSSVVELLSKD